MTQTPAPGARRVDVGVVTFNSAVLTAGCLRRLLDTDQGCQVRVLVHDNASSDGTPEVLARQVPEAEVEVASTNQGFARAVNRLLQRSDAPWFVALNSDAWPEPGALGRLVAAAEAHPDAALVVPRLLRPDGTVEHSTHRFPSLTVAALDAVGGRHWLPRRLQAPLLLQGAWNQDEPRPVDWAVGAAWLWRRRAVDAVGGLDERFFMYGEDLEWCWRARRAGWRVRLEPAAVVRHVGNASGATHFGSARVGLEHANERLVLHELLGPRRARLYAALQVVACARQYLQCRWCHQADRDHCRLALKGALGLVAPPPGLAPLPAGPPAVPASGGAEVAVVVATRDRAERLRRLLQALERQTLDPGRFEVVVVDDASGDHTPTVVADAAARRRLRLRSLRQTVRSGPAIARNRGWQATAAPVIAFTDDDCVPDSGWLAAGLAAVKAGAGVVAGRTVVPAGEGARAAEPFARAVTVDEARFFETCNVFYRRADLQAVGGFDPRFRRPSGEDTHLALQVLERGAAAAFCSAAAVAHDVRPGRFGQALGESWRWADLPLVVKGRPWVRPTLTYRWLFWKPTHPPALAAAAGLALAPRWPAAAGLALPWVVHRLRAPAAAADRWRHARALPGLLLVDLAEVATMVRGSLRHKTVLL